MHADLTLKRMQPTPLQLLTVSCDSVDKMTFCPHLLSASKCTCCLVSPCFPGRTIQSRASPTNMVVCLEPHDNNVDVAVSSD